MKFDPHFSNLVNKQTKNKQTNRQTKVKTLSPPSPSAEVVKSAVIIRFAVTLHLEILTRQLLSLTLIRDDARKEKSRLTSRSAEITPFS